MVMLSNAAQYGMVGRFMGGEFVAMWKDADVAYFKVLSHICFEGMRKIMETSVRISVLRDGIVPGISRIGAAVSSVGMATQINLGY
jgi:hypothetical protein